MSIVHIAAVVSPGAYSQKEAEEGGIFARRSNTSGNGLSSYFNKVQFRN